MKVEITRCPPVVHPVESVTITFTPQEAKDFATLMGSLSLHQLKEIVYDDDIAYRLRTISTETYIQLKEVYNEL